MFNFLPHRSSEVDTHTADRSSSWMTERPWRPRTVPFFAYGLILWPLQVFSVSRPSLYPLLYMAQCAVVLWLVIYYRRLLPELKLNFYWLAVPAGLLGALVWIQLRLWLSDLAIPWFHQPSLVVFDHMSPAVRWLSLTLRLGGMIIVVPIMEELFFRSLLLRSCLRAKKTYLAIMGYFRSIPGLGFLLTGRPFRRRKRPPRGIFTREFNFNPLGKLSIFNVSIMIVLWCVLSHKPVDFPATVVCGLLYTFVLWAGNSSGRSGGLGPVIWAHGITNSILWLYAVYTSNWLILQ